MRVIRKNNFNIFYYNYNRKYVRWMDAFSLIPTVITSRKNLERIVESSTYEEGISSGNFTFHERKHLTSNFPEPPASTSKRS